MFQAPKHIHFIGIGGIGISGLAKLMQAEGVGVSGSDAADSGIVLDMRAAGIPVAVGHAAENVPPQTDLVVYSEAVPAENAERIEAARRNVRSVSGAEFLGEYTADKRTIAVSGTNGKSTTTAMLGLILERAGMDPTVFVGCKVGYLPLGTVRPGRSGLVVIEADEYRAKYLNYRPEMIVITNIEEDHLDYYYDLQNIIDSFDNYLRNLKPDGKLVLNADDLVSMHELHAPVPPVTYGIVRPADYRAEKIAMERGAQTFELIARDRPLGEFTLRVPGRFNISNALAAACAASALGVKAATIRDALAAFPGVWRRFEALGEWKKATIVSDYGHHPTAIRLTVAAAREFYPQSRIVLVFQPHQHNRTLRLFEEFVTALQTPDLAIVSDIYHVTGREEGEDISAQDLVTSAARPEQVIAGGSLAETRAVLEKAVKPGDVVILMGAGDIDTLARELVGSK